MVNPKISSSSKHHPLHHKRRLVHVPFGAQRFLAAFEGIEGGFAIGASIVVALLFANLEQHVLLLTAIVSIIVNGFNNASVKYSSEHYLDELDGSEKKSAFRHYFMPAFIEFVFYFMISFISVMPLILINDIALAVTSCVIITLVTLFLAGYSRGFMLHTSSWRDALETMLLGTGIILVGLVSGFLVYLVF